MNISEANVGLPKARKRGSRPNNALQAGIVAALKASAWSVLNIKFLPKKYTVYPPLLILPVNFASTTPEWQNTYEGLSKGHRHELFTSIANAFKPQVITHIAINSPISLESSKDGSANIMRSPSGITPVYGDFGPTSLLHPDSGQPTQADFDAAFWVSTTQNEIIQTWAPLWTMFSRGNVTEKARILGEGNAMRGLTREEVGGDLGNIDVADFYVGIGYFAFSYLMRGVRAVLGWDISGWSVEGLRRGCERNGWECVVLRIAETGWLEEGGVDKIVQSLQRPGESKCIVLWGDNESAARVLHEIAKTAEEMGVWHLNVKHVNLGLLPTAKASWQEAVLALHPRTRGWLHVHENVDINEIERKRADMVEKFKQLVQTARGGTWAISCCHVERVKTYAPRVMHCVFDIEIRPYQTRN